MRKKNVLHLSEARQRLSQLIHRVAQGEEPVVITQRNKERAALVSIDWYRAACQRLRKKPHIISLRGMATLEHPDMDVARALAEHDALVRKRLRARAKELSA